MKIKAFLKNAWDKIQSVFKRFPISIICFAVLTIMLIVEADFEPWNVWFLCVGAVLALSMDNWRESCENKERAIGVTLGAYFVHILITVLLYFFHKSATDAHGVALVSIATAVMLSLFCLPYLRQKNDMPFWHFVFRIGIACGVSFIFTATLCGGLMLILYAFDELFDLSVPGKIYTDILIISGFFVAPVLFMAYIPSGEEKFSEELPSGKKVGDKLVHFVIMPLLGVYLFILYLYIVSIFVHWELPKGMVSLLVSSAMAVVLFLILRLYPATVSEEASFDKKLMKWLPILMLPLLVLMSVGIVRRVSDYGWTVARVYLILFNLWCYVVCIYLLKTRARRIIWIPVSIGLLFLAVSVLPLNVYKCVSMWFHHSIVSQLEKSGIQSLPLDKAGYKSWMLSLDDETRDNIHDRLLYMSGNFRRESFADLIADDVDLWWGHFDDDASEKTETNETENNTINDTENVEVAEESIPEDYKSVRIFMNKQKIYTDAIRCSSMMYMDNIQMTDPELDVKMGSITFKMVSEISENTSETYTFYINRALIEYGEANVNDEAFLVLRTLAAELYISNMAFDYYHKDEIRMRISGVLCVK